MLPFVFAPVPYKLLDALFLLKKEYCPPNVVSKVRSSVILISADTLPFIACVFLPSKSNIADPIGFNRLALGRFLVNPFEAPVGDP